jgi:hypothetical protein
VLLDLPILKAHFPALDEGVFECSFC